MTKRDFWLVIDYDDGEVMVDPHLRRPRGWSGLGSQATPVGFLDLGYGYYKPDESLERLLVGLKRSLKKCGVIKVRAHWEDNPRGGWELEYARSSEGHHLHLCRHGGESGSIWLCEKWFRACTGIGPTRGRTPRRGTLKLEAVEEGEAHDQAA